MNVKENVYSRNIKKKKKLLTSVWIYGSSLNSMNKISLKIPLKIVFHVYIIGFIIPGTIPDMKIYTIPDKKI